MDLDYATLAQLRKTRPAWQLLAARHAPLIVSFLHRSFIVPNVRKMPRAELLPKLEDELYRLRETEGRDTFPLEAAEYLDDWAQDSKGWLRKFYPPGSDEVHFDLTPDAEKAIDWLKSLNRRSFVGTESRLRTVFELLRQMVEGAETDVETRIEKLEKRRLEIEKEIERARAGDLRILDGSALRDRFQQVSGTAWELLRDFREVEQNFRLLDRRVRERISTWEGHKGDLLEKIFGERDEIVDSDQGKSFRAFWDFLMSSERQEEFTDLLEKVFSIPEISEVNPDPRLKRVHYDWLEAGEHTQRTVARLSRQLRRYLDDRAYLENKRIMRLLQDIEVSALAIRDEVPRDGFTELDEPRIDVHLPMDRPLYSPPVKPVIDAEVLNGDGEGIPTEILFDRKIVDPAKLRGHVRRMLQTGGQVTLGEVVNEHPLQQGLAELVAYLFVAGTDDKAVFDEARRERVSWQDESGKRRDATLPRIVFNR